MKVRQRDPPAGGIICCRGAAVSPYRQIWWNFSTKFADGKICRHIGFRIILVV